MNLRKVVALLYALVPLYLLFQSIYQINVLQGLSQTYEKGESYVADVIYFRLKNMQAQSNGVIELRLQTKDGQTIDTKMTLPVQMAAITRAYGKLPVRYLAESSQPIVIMPTYSFHLNMVRMNVAILVSSFITTLILGFWVLRWARKTPEGELEIRYQ
jgi:hypothetical protein